VDSVFTLNGIQLTRKTNVVTDAADGVTFNLLQGGETGNTTLTVAQNLTSATTGMQDVITKYNALLTGYKSASTSSKNSDGSIKQGPLSGDPTSRAMMAQIRSALTGMSAALASSGATYSSLGAVGVRTNADGTLSLSTSAFQAALTKDPTSVMNLFATSGGTSSGTATVKGPGQTASDLLASLSSSSSGMLATDLKNIQTNNTALATQISQGQAQLDRQKLVLQKQFSDMEVTVAMLKSSASSLTGS
jgi:flagellar hook-associated protein 2